MTAKLATPMGNGGERMPRVGYSFGRDAEADRPALASTLPAPPLVALRACRVRAIRRALTARLQLLLLLLVRAASCERTALRVQMRSCALRLLLVRTL